MSAGRDDPLDARARVGSAEVRIMQRRLVGTLFAILGLMHWPDAVLAATLAGTVAAVSGSCTADGRALRLNDPVEVSDTVIVPDGGKLTLRMPDTSMISIAPGSSMSVASYNLSGAARNARLSLTRGLLRAVVAPVGGPSTFEVSTPVGTASVRSAAADWLIEAQPGWAQVGVQAGTVDLTSAATGRSVTIRARWGGRQEAGRDPVPPRLWGQVEYDQRKARTE
jgi:hypothetical protein